MRLVLSSFFIIMGSISFAQSPQKPIIYNYDSILSIKKAETLGKPFPGFSAKLNGQIITNELLKNKIVLINFWFEGCHPCMAEMQALNELNDSLKINKDFLFISFTWDDAETIKRVKERYAINFHVLPASQNECSRLNFGLGYPTSIILDKTGAIKYFHSGGFDDKDNARAFIMNELLPQIKKEF